MEVLAAGALFMIILLGVLPLIVGAGRNLAYARENQRLSLAADSLSLAVRDMVLAGTVVTHERIENLARGLGVDNYRVFIFGINDNLILSSPAILLEGETIYNLTGFGSLAICSNSRLIYVIVRNEHNAQAGRSISTALDFRRPAGIWRNPGG